MKKGGGAAAAGTGTGKRPRENAGEQVEERTRSRARREAPQEQAEERTRPRARREAPQVAKTPTVVPKRPRKRVVTKLPGKRVKRKQALQEDIDARMRLAKVLPEEGTLWHATRTNPYTGFIKDQDGGASVRPESEGMILCSVLWWSLLWT